ncbi:hypothetical protein P7C71_g1193, partial [Lecanoromycetidae sp. Uapishka_2]
MSAFEAAINIVQGAGANVVDQADFTTFDTHAFGRNASIVLGTDFIAGLSDYFAQLTYNPNDVHNLHDIAQFTKDDPREENSDRGIYVWERELERNITNDSQESYDAYQANLRMAGRDGVIGVLDRYKLDALIMPTFASFQLPAIAGLPVITVPLGFYPSKTPLSMNLKGTMVNVAPNIPFGIAFVGRRWSEETLISLAYAFEQRTMAREKMRPFVRPTFELGDRISHAAEGNPAQEKENHNYSARWKTIKALIALVLGGLFSRGGGPLLCLELFQSLM